MSEEREAAYRAGSSMAAGDDDVLAFADHVIAYAESDPMALRALRPALKGLRRFRDRFAASTGTGPNADRAHRRAEAQLRVASARVLAKVQSLQHTVTPGHAGRETMH